MEGKECECQALRLVDTMIKAYDYWGEKPIEGEEKLATHARVIFHHLFDQLYAGDYAEKQEPHYGFLLEMRTALHSYDAGGSGVEAMEMVRNRIHANDELKQLMVCGSPYTDKERLNETAKVLAQALDAMEYSTTKEARSILDKQSEKLKCSR